MSKRAETTPLIYIGYNDVLWENIIVENAKILTVYGMPRIAEFSVDDIYNVEVNEVVGINDNHKICPVSDTIFPLGVLSKIENGIVQVLLYGWTKIKGTFSHSVGWDTYIIYKNGQIISEEGSLIEENDIVLGRLIKKESDNIAYTFLFQQNPRFRSIKKIHTKPGLRYFFPEEQADTCIKSAYACLKTSDLGVDVDNSFFTAHNVDLSNTKYGEEAGNAHILTIVFLDAFAKIPSIKIGVLGEYKITFIPYEEKLEIKLFDLQGNPISWAGTEEKRVMFFCLGE